MKLVQRSPPMVAFILFSEENDEREFSDIPREDQIQPLWKLKLLYDPHYKRLVCVRCGYTLKPRPETIKFHFNTRHQNTPFQLKKEVYRWLEANSSLFSDPVPFEPSLIPLKPMLGVRIRDGFQCVACAYEGIMSAFSTLLSFQVHLRRAHANVDKPVEPRKVSIQGTNGLKSRWVVVLHSESLSDKHTATSAECWRTEWHSAFLKAWNVSPGPNDGKELPMFLQLTNWHSFVEDIPGALIEMTRDFIGSEAMEEWRGPFWEIFSCAEGLTRVASHKLLETLVRDIHPDKRGQYLKALQEKQSFERYTSYTFGLLCFALSCCNTELQFTCLQPYEGIEEAFDEYLSNPDVQIKDLIVRCLRELVYRRFGPMNSRWDDLIFRYLCISHYQSDGTFASPDEVSQHCSILKHHLCLFVLYDVATTCKSNDEAIKLISFLHVDEFLTTPFINVVKMGSLSARFSHQNLRSNSWWEGNNFEILRIGGNRLSLETLGDGVVAMLKEYDVLLQGFIDGFDVPTSLSFESGRFKDQVGCRKPGYSFLFENQELVRSVFTSFLLHLMEKRKVSLDDQRIRLSTGFRSTMRSTIPKLMKLLYVLSHMTMGNPARSTEEITFQLMNTSKQVRNVFIMADTICFIPSYNKTSSQGSSEKFIARFLPQIVSNRLLVYLVLVRSFENLLLLNDHEDGLHSISATFLWTVFGKRLTPSQLISAFEDTSTLFCKLSSTLHFSHYRTAVSEFAAERIGLKSLDAEAATTLLLQATISAFDRQSGHTEETAGIHYHRSNFSFDRIHINSIVAMRGESRRWHLLLGVADKENVIRAGSSAPKEISGPQLATRETSEDVEMSFRKARESEIQTALSPSVQYLLTKTTALNTSEGPSHLENHRTVLPELTVCLRKMLRSLNAVFKSPEQFKAVTHAAEAKKDLLCILPTGGGKSIVWLLPVFMEISEGQRYTSVVIVPTLALMLQTEQLCLDYKIPFQRMTGALDISHGVVLLSHSQIREPELLFELSKLIRTKQLRRVVIDECHLLVDWSGFRPGVKDIRPFLELECSVILISASVSRQMEELFRNEIGSTLQIVRKSTNRPELQYELMKVWGSISKLCVHIITLLRDTLNFTTEKAVVYCPTISLCVDMFKELRIENCFLFHGEMSEHDKSQAYKGWLQAEHGVMVATTAFGVGMDYKSVRLTVILQGCASVNEFVQMSGRCGRDGLVSRVVIISDESSFLEGPVSLGRSREEREYLFKLLFQNDECFRASLHGSLDSERNSFCFLDPLNAPCFICSKVGTKPTGSVPFPPSNEFFQQRTDDAVLRSSNELASIIRLKELLSDWSDHCPFCLLFLKKKKYHKWIRCPHSHGRCLQCMSTDHSSSRCGLVPSRPKGFCWRCFIPLKPFFGRKFHSEDLSGGCDSGGNDLVKPLAFGLWNAPERQHTLTKLLPQGSLTLNRYHDWLLDPTQQFPRILIVLASVVSSLGE